MFFLSALDTRIDVVEFEIFEAVEIMMWEMSMAAPRRSQLSSYSYILKFLILSYTFFYVLFVNLLIAN